MDSSNLSEILLKQSQQEIAVLRTDLYGVKRQYDDLKARFESTSSKLQQQIELNKQLESKVKFVEVETNNLRRENAELKEIKDEKERREKEVSILQDAQKLLQEELHYERQQRSIAEEAKVSLELEKARLQKMRDDLSAHLRLTQQKLQNAEEELLHAEEEATNVRQELKVQQALITKMRYNFSENRKHDLSLGYSEDSRYLLLNDDSGGRIYQAKAEAIHDLEPMVPLSILEGERLQATILMNDLSQARGQVVSLTETVEKLTLSTSTEVGENKVVDASSQTDQLERGIFERMLLEEKGLETTKEEENEEESEEEEEETEEEKREGVHNKTNPNNKGDNSTNDVPREVMKKLKRRIKDLQSQTRCLKLSRSALLEQIDRQWGDIENIGTEAIVAQEQLKEARGIAIAWEWQAQLTLKQANEFKEALKSRERLLASPTDSKIMDTEETRKTSINEEPKIVSLNCIEDSCKLERKMTDEGQEVAEEDPVETEPRRVESSISLDGQAVKENIVWANELNLDDKVAGLSIDNRSLSMELLRTRQALLALGRISLPALAGIEERLQTIAFSA
mmetsp:Transcript_22931/g.40520  ORF Transcript_22931/g.40520 Transcript_22931/m.40520 type:complete len:568 (-) Transcript_22931:116-1819(-)|eukprot:CAMPEP_0175059170 /NCGR_PEP_ID=MMETSP0052_2-20121109/12278_1 /TAXON_ID=51329 ORGANISM="Polytomella parva, Strain SAG 63-3" /NCGR_SAMPLE_ID=MMETSP0052_2 /ASSEMBLY_ACC=CAM_ASM_000194 /LENGTH=567 /DNA_ID=CAMNT_0016324679 /DNA_START=67 /DNA_END=1770 /DNA_ORIENTATION=-